MAWRRTRRRAAGRNLLRSEGLRRTMAKDPEQSTLPTHGAAVLPSVEVDSYNLEVEDEDGFVGDKASKGAFWRDARQVAPAVARAWRGSASATSRPTRSAKKKLDALLAQGHSGGGRRGAERRRGVRAAARQGHPPVPEDQRPGGTPTCIVIGGGFRASRVGELAIGAQRELILKAEEHRRSTSS